MLDEVRDCISAEIDRRGRLGWLEPVFQKGTQAVDADGKPAFIRRFDSKLLLARARALMPSEYGEKRTIDITHHKGTHGMMVIEGTDIPALSHEQQANLSDIMATIRACRDGTAKQLEHMPMETLDVPVVEVEPVLVEVVKGDGDAAEAAETFPPWTEE